jgi:phage terminase large subunit-like protein
VSLVDAHADAIAADLDRRKDSKSLVEEGIELASSLRMYLRHGWHVIRPDDPFVDNWHIGAMCEKLEAVTAGEIRKLFIWVPPGSTKTITANIAWPTWSWTRKPSLRFLCWSYDMDIAIEAAVPARDLLLSSWYLDRWGHLFELKEDLNKKAAYFNTRGGARFSAAPNAKKVTGRHVDIILADDPNDAVSVEGFSETELDKVNNFHDGALPTRFKNPKTGVEVIIQQRLHEKDLSGHLLDAGWEVLCLPERYDPHHQFVWPTDPRRAAPPVSDPKRNGPLLWPERIGEAENAARLKTLGEHRAAGQLQQEPASRQGEILLRAFWNYYPEEAMEAAEEFDVSMLPRFTHIVCSWDTAFKDKTTNDPVAGGVWGIIGPDRYLLRTFDARAALAKTKTEMKAMREWALARWPNAALYTLIEKKANGAEIIAQLRTEIPGVRAYNPGDLDKTQRAVAAEPDFNSGNVFIAGAAQPPHDELGRGQNYVPVKTPAWAQDVIEQCAKFPRGRNDDLVDMTTQAVNWTRKNIGRGSTLLSPADMQMPALAGIPAGASSILGS